MLRHVTHNYFITFVKGLFPHVSEAHCGHTSLHEYVIPMLVLTSLVFLFFFITHIFKVPLCLLLGFGVVSFIKKQLNFLFLNNYQ